MSLDVIGKLQAQDMAKKKKNITQGGIGQDPGMYFSKSTGTSSSSSVALLSGDGWTHNVQGSGIVSLGYAGTSQRMTSIRIAEYVALFSAFLSLYQISEEI